MSEVTRSDGGAQAVAVGKRAKVTVTVTVTTGEDARGPRKRVPSAREQRSRWNDGCRHAFRAGYFMGLRAPVCS